MEESNYVNQNIIIEDRKKLNITGVKDVTSFDDETLLIETVLGRLTVKGEELHISSYNTDTGDLYATGRIHAVVYMSDGKSSGGFVSRLFR
ncbi:MAG: sporulation protein YabP [Clostridia bacterium]|nr:sporulation protein YabP [Clostridia bacterium]